MANLPSPSGDLGVCLGVGVICQGSVRLCYLRGRIAGKGLGALEGELKIGIGVRMVGEMLKGWVSIVI
jgi:hypothetical protein